MYVMNEEKHNNVIISVVLVYIYNTVYFIFQSEKAAAEKISEKTPLNIPTYTVVTVCSCQGNQSQV